MPHPAELSIDELLKDCDLKLTRGSGPGGQHRNKVETAVVLTHRPTRIIGQASEQRSQQKNRVEAIRRLRINLALAVRIERGEKYSPSELWQSRLRSQKIIVSSSHDDFPALLAEAIDVLVAHKLDVSAATGALKCSSSQLIKFLKLEPHAFTWLNRSRQQVGLRTLN